MIEVTQVKIYPFEPGAPEPALRAYAEITLNDALVIKGIKIFVRKNGGMFIGFPAQPGKDDTWHDLVVPKSDAVKKSIRDAVIEAYKRELGGIEGSALS